MTGITEISEHLSYITQYSIKFLLELSRLILLIKPIYRNKRILLSSLHQQINNSMFGSRHVLVHNRPILYRKLIFSFGLQHRTNQPVTTSWPLSCQQRYPLGLIPCSQNRQTISSVMGSIQIDWFSKPKQPLNFYAYERINSSPDQYPLGLSGW